MQNGFHEIERALADGRQYSALWQQMVGVRKRKPAPSINEPSARLLSARDGGLQYQSSHGGSSWMSVVRPLAQRRNIIFASAKVLAVNRASSSLGGIFDARAAAPRRCDVYNLTGAYP
jgi:hypothetical protein